MLFPTPKVRVVELIGRSGYSAKLQEPREGRRHSGQADEILPPYNAYSTDGDVTGELVYVKPAFPMITTCSHVTASM